MSAAPIVLIVEDQPTSALILRANVERCASARKLPIRIVVANTAPEAIACAQREMPAYVLLDLVLLGGGDGEEVLRHVRSNGAPCRVVVLSGLNPDIPIDAARLAKLRELHPDAVLPKPSPPSCIGAALFPAPEEIP